jgi:hypothetical protein
MCYKTVQQSVVAAKYWNKIVLGYCYGASFEVHCRRRRKRRKGEEERP